MRRMRTRYGPRRGTGSPAPPIGPAPSPPRSRRSARSSAPPGSQPGSVDRGASLARAGDLAVTGGRLDEAEPLLREAIEILERGGARAEAANAEARLGELLFSTDRIEEAVARLSGALAVYESGTDEEATATVSAQLARFLFFEGRSDEAMQHVERALELSERLHLALGHRPGADQQVAHPQAPAEREPRADAPGTRSRRGIGDRPWGHPCLHEPRLSPVDRRPLVEAQEVTERGLAIARRRGDRLWERSLATNLVSGYFAKGRWDEAEAAAAELPDDGEVGTDPVHASMRLDLATIALLRGEDERAGELAAPFTTWRDSARIQTRGIGVWARALSAMAAGRHADAAAECLDALADPQLAGTPEAVEIMLEVAADAAWTDRDAESLARAVELRGGDAARDARLPRRPRRPAAGASRCSAPRPRASLCGRRGRPARHR